MVSTTNVIKQTSLLQRIGYVQSTDAVEFSNCNRLSSQVAINDKYNC